MATPKKITFSPAISRAATSGMVRFTMGDKERLATDEWRDAIECEEDKAKTFYRVVLQAHDIVPAFLRKPADRARTNEEGAAYDFTQAVFYRLKLGAEVADAMADPKVTKDTILHPPGKTPQTKQALRQSYGGAKAWGVFLTRLEAIHAAIEAEVSGVEEPTKKKPVASVDKKFLSDTVGRAIKRANQPVEKHDGSVQSDAMKKFAAYLADGLKLYGIE